MSASHAKPAWERCRGCPDYWCSIHRMHAHDCDCPPIEEWIVDPYYALTAG